MSFFLAADKVAQATKKSNDMGGDGFARHPDGLIVVQCKRYGPANLVGRPAVQQFKGVIKENDALRGYLVTTRPRPRPAPRPRSFWWRWASSFGGIRLRRSSDQKPLPAANTSQDSRYR